MPATPRLRPASGAAAHPLRTFDDSMKTTIYRAKAIRTMNPARPLATHVAVRDGRIVGTGSLETLSSAGDCTLDDRFADKVLMPGFVEGHSHLMEGGFWRFVYCGFHDRRDPDGRTWQGLGSLDAVIGRLHDAAGAPARAGSQPAPHAPPSPAGASTRSTSTTGGAPAPTSTGSTRPDRSACCTRRATS